MRYPIVASPVEGRPVVTSPFGKRVDPVTKKEGTHHNGIDLRAAMGAKIFAPFAGRVQSFFDDEHGGGLSLLIFHPDEWRCGFAHLSQVVVADGTEVGAGELVALAGNSGGHTTGTHLHFTLRAPGQSANLDPKPFLLGGSLGKVVSALVVAYAAAKGFG